MYWRATYQSGQIQVLDCSYQRIAEELIDAGIAREKIALGFQPPDLRQYTNYGAAFEPELAR